MPQIGSLAGTVALVTGASRGIGAAAAIELARRGAHLVLTARTQGGLEATDDAIRALGGLPREMPIYMLTANVFAEDVSRYRAAGVDGVLKKPIEVGELFAALAGAAARVEPPEMLEKAG